MGSSSSGSSGDLSGTVPPTEAPTQLINTQAHETQGSITSTASTAAKQDQAREAAAPSEQPAGANAPASSSSSSASASAALPPSSSRFMPTQEWLEFVKAELQLTTVMRLLQYLVPQVPHTRIRPTHPPNQTSLTPPHAAALPRVCVLQIDELCEHGRETGQGVDERAILSFLRSTTLVGRQEHTVNRLLCSGMTPDC